MQSLWPCWFAILRW